MVAKVDEELKKLSLSYNEKVQALGAVQRKKSTNLATSDFEDFLTPDQIGAHEFLNTEFLITLVVVVPGQLEQGMMKYILFKVINLITYSLFSRVFEII